jgi:hypothetical protein
MKLTKNDFISNLNELIPDNGTQQISPLDLRTVITNSIDSTVNFLSEQTLNSANIGSPETTSTRVGLQALGKIDLPGYITSGNSALGYQSLYGNYQGTDNTAVGAFSLGCNLYGDYNVGVGYTALAGNVRGSGNIGLGSHTLQSNKNGDFNIAIGHGAGYYIGNYPASLAQNSYKLYIASTPINSDTTCSIEAGVGPAPLVYGDLKTLRFGIATKTLHGHGSLQVSGDISPTESGSFNLGNSAYPWHSVNESIYFSGGKIGIGTSSPSGNEGLVTVAGSIVPSQYGAYTLGNSNLAWDGYFNDITVSGLAHIVDLDYVTKEQWIYEALTLHLGASGGATVGGGVFTGEPYGPIRGYLDDNGADGGGFILHTSGADYQRDYKFIYKAPDVSLTCLESDSAFSRGRWYSNISLEVEHGRHVKTDRVMADDSLSLVSRSGCYGLFINTDHSNSGNKVYLGPESYVGAHSYSSDINFYGSPSGTDFDVSTIAVESGVKVSHSLLSRARLSDPRGFVLNYHDESDTAKDRFTITNRYKTSTDSYEPFTIMLDKSADGIFGLTDFEHDDSILYLPKTMFHIQSTGNCDARISSRASGKKSRLQLTRGSERASGIELSYEPDIFDISLLKPSGLIGIASGVMSVSTTGVVIGSTQVEYASRLATPATPLVVSHPSANSGTISLREQSSSPTNIAGFGSIFVKPYTYGGQQQSLFFRDDANTEFNLIQDPEDPSGNLVYVDAKRNTHAGIHSPYSRVGIINLDNTTYGYVALSGVTTGDGNTTVGSYASALTTTGSNNVAVGYKSNNINSTGNNNVTLGSKAASDSSNSFSNSIVIGYQCAVNQSIPDSSLLIGTGSQPLISGSLSSRDFGIDNGSLSVFNNTKSQTLKLRMEEGASHFYEHKKLPVEDREASTDIAIIDVVDNDSTEFNQFGGLSLAFTKSNGQSGILMNFRHNADPMDYSSVTYHDNTTDRPYAEVLGDLRLVGDIKFSDGTYLKSASTISATGGYGISLNTRNGVSLYDLDFTGLTNALSIDSSIDTENSFVSISIPSGVYETQTITKLSIQGLTDLVESGFAAVSDNCNMLFTENDASIDVSKNNRSIFIGCEAGAAATGWRNSVMIGTQAGQNATSPNADIHGGGATNTACTFVGYRAGQNADNISDSMFMGADAGYNAAGAVSSMFIGTNAGLNSNFTHSVGIGQNALRGNLSAIETGSGNIEIIRPSHDNERLFYNTTSESARINIGNVFAGDMWQKRMSIGQAVLSPTSVLDVNHSPSLTPDGHTGLDHIQKWNSDGVAQAAVSTHKCSGFMEVDPNGATLRPLFIEGTLSTTIAESNSIHVPRSGVLDVRFAQKGTTNLNINGDKIYVTSRDACSINIGVHIVAVRIGCEYRPIYVGCPS